HDIEQLSNVLVVQRDTAPGPITLRAVSVDVDLTAQPRVLQRCAFFLERAGYLLVLAARYQPIPKTTLGVLLVWIADSKRKIELTVGILDVDVEISFGRSSIASLNLVFYRTEPERDAISSDYS